ncbi:MAG: Acyl dehydratase [Chloroflexi bacterium]|jgi:acyl dehydratase|nr:MAG: Acyl dehydratase [Chloroflexota bacterium]
MYWEDVRIGTEIPSLEKYPTKEMLLRYASVTGDLYRIHYDEEYAKSIGLPGVIVQGGLKNAFLAQLITDWIQGSGRLRKLTCAHRDMDFPNSTLICKGFVSRRYRENGLSLVDCTIWIENDEGYKTTPGSAIVNLDSRPKNIQS